MLWERFDTRQFAEGKKGLMFEGRKTLILWNIMCSVDDLSKADDVGIGVIATLKCKRFRI
jgi:hypothetical protein